jgi:two-component system sensor histidine kinase VicK
MVIQNLLSNSVKYTPSGGRINFSIKKEKDSIKIIVSDTGVGIPLHQQYKIFEKLFRADNIKTIDPIGTGLGLYIVYEIISHSGGKIWFESKEGKGTTFYITFPITGMTRKEGVIK